MKKIKSFLLLVFALIFSLSSCGKNHTNDIGLKENGKLIVSTNAEFPPFEYLDGSEFEGIDMDINKLDVEKALSDMDKDKVLQQYQYFVGTEMGKLQQQNQEGMAFRSGENFIL